MILQLTSILISCTVLYTLKNFFFSIVINVKKFKMFEKKISAIFKRIYQISLHELSHLPCNKNKRKMKVNSGKKKVDKI